MIKVCRATRRGITAKAGPAMKCIFILSGHISSNRKSID